MSQCGMKTLMSDPDIVRLMEQEHKDSIHFWNPVSTEQENIWCLDPLHKRLLNYIKSRLDMFGIKKMRKEIEYLRKWFYELNDSKNKLANHISKIEKSLEELNQINRIEESSLKFRVDSFLSLLNTNSSQVKAIMENEGYVEVYGNGTHLEDKGYRFVGNLPESSYTIWYKKKK